MLEAYQQYLRRIDYEGGVEAVTAEWCAGRSLSAVDDVSDAVSDQLAVFGSVM